MRNLQSVAGLAVVALALAAAPHARADVYDYGYGPVYNSYPVVSGTCPNGQCSGSYYTPIYSTSYPIYSSPTYSTQTCPTCPNGSCSLGGSCPNGTCGSCPNGMCGLRGQCSGGQCTSGACRSGRCGTCPSGDCERGNCSGNCPNGQCTTRYRGSFDSLSRPASPSFDRPDFGAPEGARAGASYRPAYSADRPSSRDYRDEPVSRRRWRDDRRPVNRDSDLESPFYN
jgi:hypothetical protein